MTNKFFEVRAKCGHVGKNYYYEGVFYIKAENAKEAAAKGRVMPRVKHDHKDAILSVAQLSREEFKARWVARSNIPYYQCRNRQEQQNTCFGIYDHLVGEPRSFQYQPTLQVDRKCHIATLHRMERKLNKNRNYYESIGN
jgi:hypothetical protein